MYRESNFLGAQAASLVERFLYILRPYLRGSLGAFTVDASESSLYIYTMSCTQTNRSCLYNHGIYCSHVCDSTLITTLGRKLLPSNW